ncbi:cytochrome c-type biogenesis CcmF C-terminal domain-containing protein [Microbacterium album]|uniref:Cytochrome c biogenesis protein CcmF n=1 Tax=Microbacterium album TaxID=2053191 RepID=A0A917MN28_9MICO|nr:cytochrome c-type biogenesis CcmF C-terminal domain-containing protein [Microbacterium album]GGH48002.1 cytochrome c biogenesis protein CcmF [Microbacterium album]
MTALGTALLAVLIGAAVTAAALWSGSTRRQGLRRPAAIASGAAVAASAAACAVMLVALLAEPGVFAYSQRAIEPGMPTYYRVTSLWAGLEGSLLLWLFFTAAVATVFALARPRIGRPAHAVASATLSAVTAAFGVVALVAAPFAAATAELGQRPSPLLQDHPAMGLHPPLLYAGFTALAVPYALSLAAMLARSWDVRWARAMRAWTAVAWMALTAGIGLGAWWSYAVLGWGGYWAWDPVENASLMPWLLATALLHAVGPRARGAGWQRAAVGLGIAAYVFVLLATYLTRSGVVASIHAFSVSAIGPLLLAVLCAAALVPVIVAPLPHRLPPRAAPVHLLSRQGALRVQRMGLVAITAIVLVGSVLPALLAALSGARVTLGPPWYERILAPFALVLLVVMAVAPWMRWRRDAPAALIGRLRAPAVAAALATAGAALLSRDVGAAFCWGIGAFLLVTTAVRFRSGELRSRAAQGAAVAHLGVAVAAIAVTSGAGAVVAERTVAVGESVSAGDVSAVLVDVQRTGEERRVIESARVVVADGDRLLGEMVPELRWYGEHGVVLAGPAVRSEPLRDVYVTLLAVDPAQGGATVRLAVMPFVTWLWVSVVLLIAGMAIAVVPQRRERENRHAAARDAAVTR